MTGDESSSIRIDRVEKPTLELLRLANEVCKKHWQFLEELDQEERFRTFQALGVELVVARRVDEILGVCFVLPDRFEAGGVSGDFVWLFQLYADPASRNLGAMILLRMMNWYPAITCIGITKEALEVYHALRWRAYDPVWRCVHPLDPARVIERYRERFASTGQMALVRVLGFLGGPAMRVLEYLLGLGVRVERVPPGDFESTGFPGLDKRESGDPNTTRNAGSEKGLAEEESGWADVKNRARRVAGYLTVLRVGRPGRAVEAALYGGVGRVTCEEVRGWNRLRVHARLWRELRRYGAVASEHVAVTEEARRKAFRIGAMPVPMPIYYWDPGNRLAPFLAQLPDSDFTFASCDKIY